MSIFGKPFRKAFGRNLKTADSSKTKQVHAAAVEGERLYSEEKKPDEEEEYELVEIEIAPARIICPDCGGITLEGLEFCDKCGGELQ